MKMKSNIFFLVIDSLRQDKCIGKLNSSSTPNLDKLIQSGTFFNQTISTAPITVPSLSSIFTGLYPFECTTIDNNLYNLNQNLPIFSDDLIKSGYNTHAIIPEALKHTNISKLFENVEFFNSFATLYDENLGNKIIKTLKQNVKSPWFLFVHLVDLHGNALFNLKDNSKKSEANYTGINQYAKMLSALDPWLGKIFQCINLKNTICVITSDHGSTFADFTNKMLKFNLENDRLRKFEPGFSFNSAHKIATKFPKKLTPLRKKLANMYTKRRDAKVKKKLEPRLDLVKNLDLSTYQKRLLKKSILYPCDCFDENFRPALILLGPDIPSGKIISEQSSSIDLFPTILDLIKIPTRINHRGKSLVPLLTNTKTEPRVLMIDSTSNEFEAEYGNTIGLRTKQHKYFRDRLSENKNVHLYDLVSDPLEEHNIYQNNPDIVEQMELELKKIHNNKDFSFKTAQNLSDAEIQNAKKLLKDLGYV